MTNRTPGEILADLTRITKAIAVEPTAEELALIEEWRLVKIHSEETRAKHLKEKAERAREAALLAQAKGEMASDDT